MDNEEELGPAMLALTMKQRGFVMAMIEFPGISHSEAARRAGYADLSEAAKVRGYDCAHNPAVQMAIREEAGRRLNSLSLTAANVMMMVMMDPEAPLKEKLKAASAVLDRTGFGAAQTINVNKTVTDRSGKAVLARLRELAVKHGLDAGKLLGGPEEAVEAEFTEVTPSPDYSNPNYDE